MLLILALVDGLGLTFRELVGLQPDVHHFHSSASPPRMWSNHHFWNRQDQGMFLPVHASAIDRVFH